MCPYKLVVGDLLENIGIVYTSAVPLSTKELADSNNFQRLLTLNDSRL
jgi:hypothetical protein